jgi:phosphatidylinositol alpha-1,6-mannosyltransferase
LQKFPNLENVTVIHPGVDFKHYRRRVANIIDKKYLLSVGRLTERKGLVPFIENCFLKISSESNDVCLVIVGDEPRNAMYHKPGYKRRIKECLRTLNLQDRVALTGWVNNEQLLSLYQNCEALVFPVLSFEDDVEGFGMVAIEAAAAGRPTVAFDIGGISDAVMNNETGILIPPGHYEEMADALLSILTGQRRFSNTWTHISKNFDWDVLRILYRDYINRIINNCYQKRKLI